MNETKPGSRTARTTTSLRVGILLLALAGCSYQRSSLLPPVDLPEHVYVSPRAKAYPVSRVGLFRFAEPHHAPEMGRVAAEAIYDDLQRKNLFAVVANETWRESTDTAELVELGRAGNYDLIITGDLAYYYDGSDLQPARVDETIRVIHVSTQETLWRATSAEVGVPASSTDYILLLGKGAPAPATTTLLQRNAEKFTNMIMNLPPQDFPSSTHKETEERSEGTMVIGLRKQVAELTAQTEQLELLLREEIQKGSVRLTRCEKKTILSLDSCICFDSGSAELREEVKKTLSKVAIPLRNFPDHSVQVEGHTDNVAIHTPKYPSNWELSTDRAVAVLRYLVDKQGLNPKMFSAVGYGEYRPLASNDTPENRQMNRRVDIVITSR